MIVSVLMTLFQINVILIGFAIAFRAWQLSDDNQQRVAFRLLAAGFAIFSLGMTVETVLLIMEIALATSHLVETVLAIIGLICIIRAILLVRL